MHEYLQLVGKKTFLLILICAFLRKNVTGWGRGLIVVNPDIFLEILNKTTNTPKSGYPVSVLKFEPGSNRMHN